MLTRPDLSASDFSRFHLPVHLADGTLVLIRAVRRDDGPKIRRAFHTLGPEAVHARFFDTRADVSDAELTQIADVDFKRDAALLATIRASADEIIIGGTSYFARDGATPPLSAELAFTIVEGYQGRGLGRLLLKEIIAIAYANGLTYLDADLLANNIAMLTLFRHCGLPMALRHDDEMLHIRLELAPPYTASSATATSPSVK
jgi:GNAT superfamily N-acetyltransferase